MSRSTVTRTKAAHVYGQDAIKAPVPCAPSSSRSLLLLETVQEISVGSYVMHLRNDASFFLISPQTC